MSEEKTLDKIDHFAINVADLDKSIKWYQQSFSCNLVYQDKTQAILEFANLKLVLVLPSHEPPHLAIYRKDASSLGTLRHRAFNIKSTFISDPTGGVLEIIGE